MKQPSAEIDGSTRTAGVIGWPVEHTLSPAMHNAAYTSLGMNWRYLAFAVRPERLAQAIAGVRGLGLAGLNVTIPHKEGVIPLLDSLTPAARAIGAVNSITPTEDGLEGENTDVLGLMTSLQEGGVEITTATRVLILGAGGAARAACFGVLEKGGRISVYTRNRARGERLAADMRTSLPSGDIAVVDSLTAGYDLIINATPVGMWPDQDASPLPPAIQLGPQVTVMDMIYRPQETKLLKAAQIAGARTISGVEMLVGGGGASFARWSGRKAPIDVMRAALLQALSGAANHGGTNSA